MVGQLWYVYDLTFHKEKNVCYERAILSKSRAPVHDGIRDYVHWDAPSTIRPVDNPTLYLQTRHTSALRT